MDDGGYMGISLAGRWECGGCGASGPGWYDDEDGLVLQDQDGQQFFPDQHECD